MYPLNVNYKKQIRREALAIACFKTLLRKGNAKLDHFYFQTVAQSTYSPLPC